MNNNGFLTRPLALIAALGFSVCTHAEPLTEQELQVTPSGEIQLSVTDRPLSDVLETLEYTQPVRFQLDELLAETHITLDINTDDWDDLTRQVLSGFNWIEQVSDNGAQQIFILERTDEVAEEITVDEATDEADAAEEPIDALALDAEDSLFSVGQSLTDPSLSIPEQLSAYPDSGVQAVDLDYAALQQLQPGDVITLKLPSGEHYATFVESEHDDDSGVSSWTGYIGDEEAAFDVIITHGEDGLFAHINTPDGLQTIETINGQQWWIDVANSGLDHPDAINDTFQLPTTPSIVTTAGLLGDSAMISDQGNMSRNKARSALNKWQKRLRIWKKRFNVWKKRYKSTRQAKARKQMRRYLKLVKRAQRQVRRYARASRGSASNRIRNTRIDLLVAYTSGISTTRAKHLVNLANNSFANSGVRIRLRIVKMVNVSYTITNDNSIALTDLTYSKKQLSDISQLRDQHKADLVTLVRPFRYPAQDSCGIAWLGGANGSNFHPITGFSVVSDGANNGYYCSDYTLAHEIGHNLGSAHDRAHAGAAGAYSYSYGFGESGKAGSIMSYINPEVGRFSSPGYKCNNLTCGASDANNVKSMNRSRKIIANYK